MATNKYINTADVSKLTGRSNSEILNLAKTGVLPTHRTRRGHYRYNVDAVEEYFSIQINKPKEVVEKPVAKIVKEKTKPTVSDETRLITNENHYQEVIQRICSASSSIRIMTADFKRFNLKPTGKQGKGYKNGTPFIKYLMTKAIQGVSVQLICSDPSKSFDDERKEYYRQMSPKLFEYRKCIKNHAKVVIIDDFYAYIGSANVTPAGIGQGIFTPGNFEAGILTRDKDIVSAVKSLFSVVWEGKNCPNCHREHDCYLRIDKIERQGQTPNM